MNLPAARDISCAEVCQRKDVVPLAFLLEEALHLAQLLRVFGCDVMCLTGILAHVVQHPSILIERDTSLDVPRNLIMQYYGLRSIVIDSVVAPELILLSGATCGSLGIIEGVVEGNPVNQLLRNTIYARWRLNACCCQNRRRDVDDVGVLRAHTG